MSELSISCAIGRTEREEAFTSNGHGSGEEACTCNGGTVAMRNNPPQYATAVVSVRAESENDGCDRRSWRSPYFHQLFIFGFPYVLAVEIQFQARFHGLLLQVQWIRSWKQGKRYFKMKFLEKIRFKFMLLPSGGRNRGCSRHDFKVNSRKWEGRLVRSKGKSADHEFCVEFVGLLFVK